MDEIDRLREMIGGAKRIVAFTGAGISTESGIPDFRSPGGIWTKYQPIYFDDFMSSEEMRREVVAAQVRDRRDHGARPSPMPATARSPSWSSRAG